MCSDAIVSKLTKPRAIPSAWVKGLWDLRCQLLVDLLPSTGSRYPELLEKGTLRLVVYDTGFWVEGLNFRDITALALGMPGFPSRATNPCGTRDIWDNGVSYYFLGVFGGKQSTC